jgi:flagellar biosynthetic protein FlhB
MAEEMDFQTRTEPPSPRRRERAYEEGQFALSAELTSGVVLFAGVAGLLWLAHALGGGLLSQTRGDLLQLPYSDLSPGDVQRLFIAKFFQALSIAGILIGVLFVATLGVGLAQAGFHFNFARLTIDWDRVAPYHLSRLLSGRNVMRGLFLLFKIGAIAVLAWWIIGQRGRQIAHLSDASLTGALASAWNVITRIALALATALLVIGVADYAYQRWRFERSLYMTKLEVKEELKREEGNPQIKARIRKLQRETAQRKMFHQVKRATVVVTNPTHLAVALQYEAGTMTAPKVVAKGADHVAKRIVTIAREHSVPVVERKTLAQALYKTVKVEQTIPLGLYLVVAELMAYVYRLKAST